MRNAWFIPLVVLSVLCVVIFGFTLYFVVVD